MSPKADYVYILTFPSLEDCLKLVCKMVGEIQIRNLRGAYKFKRSLFLEINENRDFSRKI